MEIKRKYERVVITQVGVELSASILSGSIPIVDPAVTTVTIPRGQKVDDYDFSEDTFSHEWEITEPGE